MRDLTNETVVQTSKNGMNYIQFKALLNLGVKHAYALKSDNLNLKYIGKFLDKDLEKKSYKNLCECIGLDYKNVVRPMQSHTNVVKCIDSVYEPFLLKDVDGLITQKEGLILATTNADCILYLLYDKKKKVIANVHSGWKGSYQRIIENAIDLMINKYNSKPEDIIVCICPSIRKCCFEVDTDVKEMFYDKFSFLDNINDFILNGYNPGKYFIDTVGINNELLKKKGIEKRNIYDCGICSLCNSDVIHSYRDEGKEYRLSTAIISLPAE